MEEKRQLVNRFIRMSGAYDAVIDFDKVLSDPAQPTGSENRLLSSTTRRLTSELRFLVPEGSQFAASTRMPANELALTSVLGRTINRQRNLKTIEIQRIPLLSCTRRAKPA